MNLAKNIFIDFKTSEVTLTLLDNTILKQNIYKFKKLVWANVKDVLIGFEI